MDRVKTAIRRIDDWLTYDRCMTIAITNTICALAVSSAVLLAR